MEVFSLNDKLIPFSDLLRNFFAVKPKDVDGVANTSAIYYREKLLRLILGRFEVTGWPGEWDLDYALSHLFLDGFFTITDTDIGVVPLQCGVHGNNVFNRPNQVIVANHVLGSFNRTIGLDCALVRLQYNYRGIDALLQRYATMLAMCDSSQAVNILNAKVSFVAFAESKAQAETMKKMYDEIAMGNPAVFMRGDPTFRDQFMFNNVKQNFVGVELQDLKSRIMDEFLSEIGIRNTNTEKRERLVTYEAESREEETRSGIAHWIETVNLGLSDANRLYDMNLRFMLRQLAPDPGEQEGGAPDEFPESS